MIEIVYRGSPAWRDFINKLHSCGTVMQDICKIICQLPIIQNNSSYNHYLAHNITMLHGIIKVQTSLHILKENLILVSFLTGKFWESDDR